MEENVTLHTERVSIDRRPASTGARLDNADFTDRTIEVTEADEEAVVSKTARVKEEVVVHKEATNRVEQCATQCAVRMSKSTARTTRPAARAARPYNGGPEDLIGRKCNMGRGAAAPRVK